ncbi:ABC transporter permease [Desulfocurvibacter africanus]|uniref:ABC transporter permease n=1 Tax=Desulfocurvibacter africanus TaxID=873 RepID=UPI000400220D|nr:ABC transporter permease [Desulfocurvibacter africanus]
MTWYAFYGALEQGFVFGLMVLGVYLTFRVLEFPDLTVDGSLPLGAAVTSVAITSGLHPVLALALAAGAGFLAGAVTGILNTKLRILHLLASILTMIALYSINIRIMGGRPNMALLGQDTVIDPIIALGIPPHMASWLLFGAIAVAAAGLLMWFLSTELGQAMLATGDNPQMVTALGVNTHSMIIFGVGLSNAMVAVSGGLVAQNQGAADANMGVGTIVAGLASVIVGETLLGVGPGRVKRAIVAAILGSVVYRLAIALALGLDIGGFSFAPSDLNLITALLVVLALTAPQIKSRFGLRRRAC